VAPINSEKSNVKARLFCRTGILSGKSIDFGEAAIIGKNPENDLVLEASIVSGRHAQIFFDKNANCYFLEDLRSRNGTKLDGLKVTQKEKLGALHVITFAEQFDFIFQVVGNADMGDEEQRAPLWQDEEENTPAGLSKGMATRRTVIDQEVIVPPKLTDFEKSAATPFSDENQKHTVPGGFTAMPRLSESNGVSQKLVLEVKTSTGSRQTFRLNEGENIIGRGRDCAIWIDDESLSRRHAVVTMAAGTLTIRDLESKNHTYLDKRRVTAAVQVMPGMKMQFGTVEAVIRTA